VLVCVPTRELAVQTLEHVQALSPMAAVLLRGTEPGLLRTSLAQKAQKDAPVLIATAGQLAKLNPVLEARGGEQVLADLRRTLRTAVLEESDAILGPKGKRVACSTGASATARWKSCRKHRRCAGSSSGARTPSARACSSSIASATLSARVMRDLVFVVGAKAKA
jgi:superfamily II DNA/RNA helicase